MISDRIKAWISLVGGILTALIGLGVIPTPYTNWLTIASAVITAVLTYSVPNADFIRVDSPPPNQDH